MIVFLLFVQNCTGINTKKCIRQIVWLLAEAEVTRKEHQTVAADACMAGEIGNAKKQIFLLNYDSGS